MSVPTNHSRSHCHPSLLSQITPETHLHPTPEAEAVGEYGCPEKYGDGELDFSPVNGSMLEGKRNSRMARSQPGIGGSLGRLGILTSYPRSSNLNSFSSSFSSSPPPAAASFFSSSGGGGGGGGGGALLGAVGIRQEAREHHFDGFTLMQLKIIQYLMQTV